MTEFPQVFELSAIYSSQVNRGDCLFIPSGTWYTLQSQGQMNLAVQFVFDNFDSLEAMKMENCDEEIKHIPLKEVLLFIVSHAQILYHT